VGLFYRVCQCSALAVIRTLWDVRIEGRENVPRTGSLLVTANHRSYLDPALLGAVVPREVGFAAKKELFKIPGFGRLIRALNAVPVDRSSIAPSTLRRFEDWVRGGNALLVFPEGTRSKDGNLGTAKTGVGMMMTKFSVPVLPVYLEGTESAFRNVFRRGRVRVVFGQPYTLPSGRAGSSSEREAFREAADVVMNAIRELRDETVAAKRGTDLPDSDAPAR
jgi:1-acyl-sn-glycerol-3-phosphate acyltransferase